MKKFCLILFFITCAISQDRSVIFNTGSPDGDDGYAIDINNSIANRFTVNNDYVLEAMVFYISASTIESSNVTVSIREDNDGIPGELVSDLSVWTHQIDLLQPNNYNLIVTTDLCIYLDGGNNYWWQINAADNNTDAIWIHSNGSLYTYASSSDGGDNWESQGGFAGAGGIWAEQSYETSINDGDVNFDFVVNILDVVSIVNYILGNDSFTEEQFILADLNRDGVVDVIDLIQLVNMVLEPIEPNPDFALLDINPASEFYTQNIGPSFFSNQVSCYYFGKQG